MTEATTSGTASEPDDAAVAARPTMAGFVWTLRPELPDPPVGDLWCLRDAICALLGRPEGSDEWHSFIKAPHPADVHPLFEHLGLVIRDVGVEPHVRDLAGLLHHPGILMFQFTHIPIGHAVYLSDLRRLAWHHATGYRQLLAPGHLAEVTRRIGRRIRPGIAADGLQFRVLGRDASEVPGRTWSQRYGQRRSQPHGLGETWGGNRGVQRAGGERGWPGPRRL